jgi:hypothetical protein
MARIEGQELGPPVVRDTEERQDSQILSQRVSRNIVEHQDQYPILRGTRLHTCKLLSQETIGTVLEPLRIHPHRPGNLSPTPSFFLKPPRIFKLKNGLFALENSFGVKRLDHLNRVSHERDLAFRCIQVSAGLPHAVEIVR